MTLTVGMVCLLDIYKNKKEKIAENCMKMLDERISLWQLVVTVSTLSDLSIRLFAVDLLVRFNAVAQCTGVGPLAEQITR